MAQSQQPQQQLQQQPQSAGQPQDSGLPEGAVAQAVELMRRSRRRGEWEAQMTHSALLPYLAEETAEFSEAAKEWAKVQENGSDSERAAAEENLRKELSDVLLQVLFHAELAAERGAFDFESVAQAFVDKMASRAPYLFDDCEDIVPIDEQEELWAAGKAAEAQAAALQSTLRSESETS